MCPRLEDEPVGGDDRFVDELYRDYHQPLLSFVLRHTGGNRPRAEDVVQEVLIRAWRTRDRLDAELGSGSLMPWLATVARRVLIDQQRRRDARPQEADQVYLEGLSTPDLSDRLIVNLIVEQALGELKPAHREALHETYLRGRSVNDAADVLGIPVGTVKSRVYYALRILRENLAEQGITY